MKVYLGGSFVAQRRLRPIRDKLFAAGHSVISSWLDEVAKPDDMPKAIFDKQLAFKDINEISEADCIITDTFDDSTTGGLHIEWGYALGHAKLRYHVGPIKSIFYHLADAHFDTWEDLLAYFAKQHPAVPYTATGMEGKAFVGETHTDFAFRGSAASNQYDCAGGGGCARLEGGWIPWFGGINPVPGVRVIYRLDDTPYTARDPVESDNLEWSHDIEVLPRSAFITAYKVVP